MSDLISRSDVLKLPRYNFGVSMLSAEEYIKFSDIEKILTAYSVDKVIEELETMSQLITFKDMFKVHENIKMVATDIATQIVKHGCVSDAVCEWKQDNMCETVYRVCGGCFTSAYQKDFKYCPYCGKKIKVVE